ncbi:hypothetical protein [Maribacter sp. ACAM166]|uniref:hypothetical protein n=1 Tax=Maribacter sp. ACAM166 TaxID=2508996 RepID=UPI00293933BD|nr:hypothetical protein [Maribacter sp. ACAM166]
MEVNTCKVHSVQVGNSYTCDTFEMKAALKAEQNCISCVRFEASDCANPKKAAPSMSCNHWAPKNASA